MEREPLASVIVMNHNYGEFLGAAIDSALAQSYPRTEVVVVDDGSTDRSGEVIHAYDGRIEAVFKENGGMGSAFNAGVAASRGAFVFMLDADDTLLPGALAAAVPRLRDAAAKVHWPLFEVDRDGRRTGRTVPGPDLPEGDLREALAREGPDGYLSPPTTGNGFSRTTLERILPVPEQEFAQQAETYLVTVAPLYGGVARIPEPQGCYRVHGENYYASRSALERNRLNLEIYDRRCDALARHLQQNGREVDQSAWKERSERYAWMRRVDQAARELLDVIPEGATFLLVDEAQLADAWGEGQLLPARRAVPFPEREGEYGGPPDDDQAAIRELDRLRDAGAHFAVFAWPAFWWLSHYPGLASRLRTDFETVIENERLVVFDLGAR